MEPTARIVVRRPGNGGRDRWRSYWLEVDGVRVASIKRGEQVEVRVAVGAHRVRAAIDWTGSPGIDVTVAEGSTTRLVVGPAGNAFQFWQVLDSDAWLTLARE